MNHSLVTRPPTGLARRRFLQTLALGGAGLFAPGAFAEQLTRASARVEEGPFYPPKLPLDTDNDLLIVNDGLTPAVGEVTHLSGRLLDARGEPVRNATIEIWEVDHTGVYLAERMEHERFDRNFQGFGRFLTGSTGEYYFRTIKPVVYEGRSAPHIHFKIKRRGQEDWTTQLFVQGHPGNFSDPIFQELTDAERQTVAMPFTPLPGSTAGELAVRFDLVLDVTPGEDFHPKHAPGA